MKLKIDLPILNFDGTIIETGGATNSVPLTMRSIIEQVLLAQQDGKPATAEQKISAYRIGLRLLSKKLAEYDLTVDQVAFLKERTGIFASPIVYGRFLELIGDEAVKEVG
jgi:hypothetical protein